MRHRLSRRENQAVFDPIAKLFRVALNELALQSLPFGTELEGDVVEPYAPIVVAIALDLGEAPFPVCLRQVEATGGTVALEERSLALQSVRKLLGAPCLAAVTLLFCQRRIHAAGRG